MKRWKRLLAVMFITSCFITFGKELTVKADFIDRVKDIYEVPDRVENMYQRYEATKAMMERQLAEQMEQLELSRQQAEQLLQTQEELKETNDYYREQNEYYRQKSEMLAAENENLLLKMEQVEQSKKSFFQKLATVIGSIIGLFVLYAIAVRVWRYMVWRRQGRTSSVWNIRKSDSRSKRGKVPLN